MALTKALLVANAALANLTDEQVAAIETLSKNDEASVIGARIGELHGQYDTDVLSVTGVAKNQGEKSYDYVKRVLGTYKTKSESSVNLQQQIDTLTTEKAALEQQIADGSGDATLKQQLADTKKTLNDTKALLKTEQEGRTKDKTDNEMALRMVHVDNAFEKAIGSMKFKASIPESVRTVMIESAKENVLKDATPDFIEENGKKSLVFRDAEGNILNNKENQLKPFTASELISSRLTDVIDNGRKAAGVGSRKNQTPQGGETFDLSSAKTQVEADEMIVNHLMAEGYTRTHQDFASKQAEIRKEADVASLPMR